jgi:hypothetical protein
MAASIQGTVNYRPTQFVEFGTQISEPPISLTLGIAPSFVFATMKRFAVGWEPQDGRLCERPPREQSKPFVRPSANSLARLLPRNAPTISLTQAMHQPNIIARLVSLPVEQRRRACRSRDRGWPQELDLLRLGLRGQWRVMCTLIETAKLVDVDPKA